MVSIQSFVILAAIPTITVSGRKMIYLSLRIFPILEFLYFKAYNHKGSARRFLALTKRFAKLEQSFEDPGILH